jgi:hypothetical protein
MKRFLGLIACCAISLGVHAQVVDTTVCDVLKDPASFNGKIVRIKSTVVAGFDQFAIQDETCHHAVNSIWLAYPEGTKAKSGPLALLQLQPAKNFAGAYTAPARTPVTLDKSKDFKQFDSLLSTPHKSAGMCLGCARYLVSATLVGRIDGVASAELKKDAAGKLVGLGGFGNLNAYPARLVLQSVADVTSKEIDYSKTDAVSKSEQNPDQPTQDTIAAAAAAAKSAEAFGPGTAPLAAIQRAANAYGKPKEDNGVTIGFGPTAEAAVKYDAQAPGNSPDGVIYNCTFNAGRLQGDQMTRAVVHMGEHIANIRTPPAGSFPLSLYESEFQGWVTTIYNTISNGQKSLTLSGSYLLWNAAWAADQRDKELNETLSKFLAEEQLLSR